MPEMSAPKTRRTAKRPGAPKAAESVKSSASEVINITALDRTALIAEAAYFRAQNRQFEPGYELEDWLAAESEVDGKLLQRAGAETAA